MVKENEIALWILKIITLVEGGFLIGVLTCIVFYYAKLSRKFELFYVYVIAVSISHLLLVYATMRTMWKSLYRLTDIWFLCVFLAYLLSNFALFVMYTKLREDSKSKPDEPVK